MASESNVFKGVIWAAIQRFGSLGISFISNMVLARLLTPDDFGTIGMLMFFIAIAQTFVDSGFGSALIQKKEICQEDKATVFVINMVMSVFLYGLLYIFSPTIAAFYDVPQLNELLKVMGLVVIINGFGMVQSAQLQKQMHFKELSICNLVGSLITAISGISAALLGCGVWSLVIRTLSGALVTNILLLVACRWKPSVRFSRKSFKQLFSFGGFMLMSSVLITITNNVQTLIIGKMFSKSSLGNYTQARNLRNIASEGISHIIGQVLYPDFASYQDNNAEIKRRLENSVYILSYMVVPVMLFCIIAGTPLIHVIYGGQWDEAVPYFRLMCIGGIPICLQDLNINVIKAKGHSKVLFYCNLVKVFVYFGLIITGAKLGGMIGLIISMIIYSALAYLAFAIIGTYFIHTGIADQLLRLGKSLLISLPSVAACYLISRFVDGNDLILLIILGTAYFGILLCVSIIVKPYPYTYLKTKIVLKR